MENVPKGLTITEVATRYGVDRSTVFRAVKSGQLVALEADGKILIHPASLEGFQPRPYRRKQKRGGES